MKNIHIQFKTKYSIPFFLVSLFRDSLIKRIVHYQKQYNVVLYNYVILPDSVELLIKQNEEEKTFITRVKAVVGKDISIILGDKGQVFETGYNRTEIDKKTTHYLIEEMNKEPIYRGIVRESLDYLFSGARYIENNEVSIIPLTPVK